MLFKYKYTTETLLNEIKSHLVQKDKEILSLKKKNNELEAIKNDYIGAQIIGKKFPKDYIKQKKEIASERAIMQERIDEYRTLMQGMEKRYDDKIEGMQRQIDFLQEENQKLRPNIFKKWLTKTK